MIGGYTQSWALSPAIGTLEIRSTLERLGRDLSGCVELLQITQCKLDNPTNLGEASI
jgi:hypothetical protein